MQVMPKCSNANRWMKCAGSVHLESLMPRTESEYQKEGIAIHALAAEMIEANSRGRLGYPKREEYVGKLHKGVLIKHDDWECAEIYADHIKEVMLKANNFNPRIESKIITDVGQTGYIDCSLDDKENSELFIVDLKSGRRPVEAVENWQMINYLASKYWYYQAWEKINIVIIQPRVKHPDGIIRYWSLSSNELYKYTKKLIAQVEFIKAGLSECRPGPHCCGCSAINSCQAAINSTYGIYDDVRNNEQVNFTPDELGSEKRFLEEASAIIKKRLQTVDAQIENYIRNGTAIRGYGLNSRKGSMKWNCDKETIKSLQEVSKLQLFKDPEPITPTQAVKLGLDKDIIELYTKREESFKIEKINLDRIGRLLNKK